MYFINLFEITLRVYFNISKNKNRNYLIEFLRCKHLTLQFKYHSGLKT